jgi:hypothetical protein
VESEEAALLRAQESTVGPGKRRESGERVESPSDTADIAVVGTGDLSVVVSGSETDFDVAAAAEVVAEVSGLEMGEGTLGESDACVGDTRDAEGVSNAGRVVPLEAGVTGVVAIGIGGTADADAAAPTVVGSKIVGSVAGSGG